MCDVSKAMAYLHGQQVYHYALHPRNVLFDAVMSVKIADYGRSPGTIARLLEDEQQQQDVAAAPQQPLAPGQAEPRQLYLAPEVLRLESFTPAADVWSLGCLIARLASLSDLYSAAQNAPTQHIIMLRVASGELSPADQLASAPIRAREAVIKLVRDCTRLDPAKRPTVAAASKRLEGIATPEGAPERSSRAVELRTSACLHSATQLPPSSSDPTASDPTASVVAADPEIRNEARVVTRGSKAYLRPCLAANLASVPH